MKNRLAFAFLLFGSTVTFQNIAQAQVQVNVNLGTPVSQSPWYATDDNYYYLPEQGVYYNVPKRVYVFPEGNQWVYAPNLPARYNGYGYGKSHYVQVRDRSPFNNHNVYAGKFGSDYNDDHVIYYRDQDLKKGNGNNKYGDKNGRGNGKKNGHRK